MSIGMYFHRARRWILFGIVPTLVLALGAYLYTAHQPKLYEASSTLYVQQPSTSSTLPGQTDVYTSQAVIPTYSQIVTLPVIARAVNKAMSARWPEYRLEQHDLTVSGTGPATAAKPQTQLMPITVRDTIPARAAAAADAVGWAFIKEITGMQRARFAGGARAIQRQLDQAQTNIQYVSQRISDYHGNPAGLDNLKAQLTAYQSIYQTLLASSQDFNVSRSTAVHGVKMISSATVPSSPVEPHPARTALLVGLLALFVFVPALFLHEYFDDTPRTPEEIEEIVGAPVLGTVPLFDTGKYPNGLVTIANPRSPLAEAYRVLRTNVQFTNVDNPPRVVVVTSASPGEGKSTTASNLAHVFAEIGRRTLLIDADMRRPSLHRIFSVTGAEGLTNLLMSRSALNGQGSQPTSQANLQLIPSGPIPPRPADLLHSERMHAVLQSYREESELVIIDSPPVLAVTDAAILSTQADGVILVVDPTTTKRRDLRRCADVIDAVGGRILGIVVNRLTRSGSPYYYYYYLHNYRYQYKDTYGDAPTEATGVSPTPRQESGTPA